MDYQGFWPNMAGTWSKDCCFWSLRRPIRSATSLSPQSYTSCLSLLDLLFSLLNPSMLNKLEDLLFLFRLIQTHRIPPFFVRSTRLLVTFESISNLALDRTWTIPRAIKMISKAFSHQNAPKRSKLQTRV